MAELIARRSASGTAAVPAAVAAASRRRLRERPARRRPNSRRDAGGPLALLLLLLLSCTAGRAKTTTIEFWGLGREGEVVAELVPQFEKETGIHVDVQQIPWTAAHEKLLTAHVGKSLPDVAQVGNTWIPELSTLHAIAPLNPFLQRGSVPQSDYFPGIWNTNVVGDTVYGIPWYVDTRVLFYRTDMIPTPPRTWSEWIAAMEKVKRESKDPHFFPLLMPTNEWPQPVVLAMQKGATFVDDDGHARFDDPNFVAAFAFYLDIYKRGLAPVMSNSQVANLYQQFGDGDFAMFVSGPWDVGNLRMRLKPEQQKTWSVAPMPAPDGTPWPGLSMSGGSSLVISKTTDKKDAAWKFIEFLSRPDIQVRFSQLSGDLPARRSAWATPELTNDREMQAFRVQLDHTAALPRIPEIENIVTKIFEHGQLATRGQFDAREGAHQLNTKVEAMLEKRRWVLQREAAR
ncbi:MAG TPA: sugar ABC transporter substrate-binding protein [Thermoanaerobaculia bacterium]